MSARAFLEGMTADVSREYPVLARGLLANQLDADDPLWVWASVAAEHVMRITTGDETRIAQCVEAFVITSLDFLRLQARFVQTGRYAHSAASESLELYGDADRMTEYLDGLALTYAMWVNHTKMLQFYAEAFVPQLPADAHLLEIGPGHGLLAAVLLGARDDVHYTGVDISPRSISYTAAAFAASGVAGERYDLAVANACDPDATFGTGDAFTGAICCEVLEHVDEPVALLAALQRRVAPGTPAFVSTVANMEAEDHVFLFHDEDHIRSVVRDGGFVVDTDQPLVLAGFETATPRPVNYSAIIRRA